MAAKTKKYYLEITSYATQQVQIELTKCQYEQMKNQYVRIVAENHAMHTEDDTEWYVNVMEERKEKEQMVISALTVCDGATYVTLRKEECKEGYRFLTQKEKRRKKE